MLYHEVAKYGVGRILQEVRRYTGGELVLAGLLTIVCYWFLTFYDWLGFRCVRHKIAYRRVTFGAFIACAFANNIGLANFAGAAVRYRLYSRWKIPPAVIGEVVALNIVSNWLGFLLTTGLVFALAPPALPPALHLPLGSVRPFGVLFLAPVLLYLIVSAIRTQPFRLGVLRFPLLRNRVFVAQILVGCLDFALSGIVLYALLPHAPALSYAAFLGSYLLADAAGILSHVPGGLGVFESVIFFSLSPRFSSPAVFGALLVYRLIYFLLPFAVAVVALAAFELRHRFSKQH